jgi:hypothetical protein
LTVEVYKGRLAARKIESTVCEIERKRLLELIKIGEESDKIVINYVDNLITALNIRNCSNMKNEVPVPHPCGLNSFEVIDKELDYENLCNCCQRHVCRVNGYCHSSSSKCRFGYPINEESRTRIEFIENNNSVRAEIKLKRNDCYMNSHNRLVCENWRANTDMQIILDLNACVNYMIKYATKCNIIYFGVNFTLL